MNSNKQTNLYRAIHSPIPAEVPPAGQQDVNRWCVELKQEACLLRDLPARDSVGAESREPRIDFRFVGVVFQNGPKQALGFHDVEAICWF